VIDAVLRLLEGQPTEAWFSTELAVKLGPGWSIARVEEALRDLHSARRVYLEDFVPPDRHFEALVVVSLIDRALPAGEAEAHARGRVQKTLERWLREVLASHRCTG
jgi:hypothetical protein